MSCVKINPTLLMQQQQLTRLLYTNQKRAHVDPT